MNLLSSALTTGSTGAFNCYGEVAITAVGTFGGSTLTLQRDVNGSWVDVDYQVPEMTYDTGAKIIRSGSTFRADLWGRYRYTLVGGSGISITAIELDGPSVSKE
jgi:hypothetical protein